MNVELQTERLIMRPPEEADLEDLHAFHDDPVVRKIFGEATREEVGEWIEIARRDWDERGHGRVVVLDREGGDFLGRSGLRYWPELDEVEVGWSLLAAARGRGLATEAGRFWLDWGLRELDLPYLTANIDRWNTASIAVAERLGMEPLREDQLHGDPIVVYALRRP
ncbi:MAG: GNAT family N-acetyltransferase [Actinobacteria bacterium]|nr:GNAT family N-acetyltransferase [Actinomycetota bacterium]